MYLIGNFHVNLFLDFFHFSSWYIYQPPLCKIPDFYHSCDSRDSTLVWISQFPCSSSTHVDLVRFGVLSPLVTPVPPLSRVQCIPERPVTFLRPEMRLSTPFSHFSHSSPHCTDYNIVRLGLSTRSFSNVSLSMSLSPQSILPGRCQIVLLPPNPVKPLSIYDSSLI